MASTSASLRRRTGFPGFLAGGAIGVFQVAGSLLHGQFLAAEIDGHPAVDLIVFGDFLGDFGVDRDVDFAEDFHFGLPAAVEGLKSFLIQLPSRGRIEIFPLQGESQGFDSRLDLFDELHEAFFDGFVVGVTAFVDVSAAAVFIDDGCQFGKVREPAGELIRIVDSAIEEAVIEGLGLSEIGWIKIGGDELPGAGICGHRIILYIEGVNTNDKPGAGQQAGETAGGGSGAIAGSPEATQDPHPNPLPEYRERGKEGTCDCSARGPAIDMSGVGVMRDGRWILRDVDWRVEAGTLAAILGPNGSGKSTLARIAACHLWPTAGRCCVLGETFGEANLPELRRRIRLVQAAGPYDVDPALTALEVVLTGFFGSIGLYHQADAEMTRQARQSLQFLGLGAVVEHPYASLSSGERMRSLIARALVTRPGLLILDEPTSGLDPLAREQVLATIQLLVQSSGGPTVVLITHHIEELPPGTSQVLLLGEGKPVASGSMEAVLRPEILTPTFGFPMEVRRSGGRYYLEVHPRAWKELLQQAAARKSDNK